MVTLADQLGGLNEQIAHGFELASAATGQQREGRIIARQGQLFTHFLTAGLERDDVSQRMSDIADRNTRLLIQRRLHRKQGQHALDGPPDLLDPSAAPGPDRRADIMHGRHAGLLQRSLEAEVEIRRIDTDEDIRAQIEQTLLQLATNAGNFTVMLERIPVAHDRQLAHRPPAIHTLRLHARPADAVKNGTGKLLLQGGDQMTAQQVAGGFARHQGYTNRSRHVSE